MPPDAKATRRILAALNRLYPQARCSLDFSSPFQLLAATVLSAQCTDERVNKTTPALFARFPDPAALARAGLPELEELIRPTGFFRNKAKNLKAAAEMIVSDYGGRTPDNLTDLVKLPGVARKTANVVLGNAFDTPGVVVDTHVKRISYRIGWTGQTNPDKIEADLMKIWPRKNWTRISHQMIQFGRDICQARRPRCADCPINRDCDFAKGEKN